MNKSEKIFTAGIAIGALLGFLLAPYSGAETRRKIKKITKGMKSKFKKARDKFKDMKENFDRKADENVEESY